VSVETAGAGPTPQETRVARRLARVDLAAAAVAILALATGFVRVGSKSLWMDEGISADHAHVGLRSLLHVVTGGDPNMGLYYVLLHFWTRIFGESEVALRSFSVLVGAAAAVAVYLLGERLFGRRAGLAAGALLALDGFFVRYEQEARAYSLLVLLVTVSSYWFVAEFERPSRASIAGYVASSALALYAHYFAGFVLLAQLVTLVAARRRAALTRRWLGAYAVIALLVVPELLFAHRKGAASALGWIQRPSLHDLAGVPLFLTSSSKVLFVAFVVLGCYAIAGGQRDGMPWRYAFLAVWFVLPIGAAFAISFGRPIFEPRYLIICLPPFVLLAGDGLARIRIVVAAAVAAAVLLALSVWKLEAWYRKGPADDWRGATRYVIAAARPGDVVRFAPTWARDPFAYYERRDHAAGLADRSAPTTPGSGRVWVVRWASTASAAAGGALERTLARTHRLATGRTYRNVVVELFRPRVG
jgi:mannosyltransferase